MHLGGVGACGTYHIMTAFVIWNDFAYLGFDLDSDGAKSSDSANSVIIEVTVSHSFEPFLCLIVSVDAFVMPGPDVVYDWI